MFTLESIHQPPALTASSLEFYPGMSEPHLFEVKHSTDTCNFMAEEMQIKFSARLEIESTFCAWLHTHIQTRYTIKLLEDEKREVQ